MKCPVCPFELVSLDALHTCTVDVCQNGCGGVWCDKGELERIDEVAELAQPAKLNLNRTAEVVIDREAPRNCPRCHTVMDRLSYDSTHQVEVDQCIACGGVWLDMGELQSIHNDNQKKELMEQTVRELNRRAEANSSGRLESFVRVVFERLW